LITKEFCEGKFEKDPYTDSPPPLSEWSVCPAFPTQADLNILSLVSYDLLNGMDWLASHKTKFDCYSKTLECENEEGRRVTLQGIKKHVSVRQISSLQVKKYCRKGCPLYAIQVLKYVENTKPNLEDHPILREYKDVFPEEVSGLPPIRDIEFSI
jgi:hypothetical protein